MPSHLHPPCSPLTSLAVFPVVKDQRGASGPLEKKANQSVKVHVRRQIVPAVGARGRWAWDAGPLRLPVRG
jgi:hypothetical protein